MYLFSEKQLKVLQNRHIKKCINNTVYIDATGGVIKKLDAETKRCFLYSVVINIKGKDEPGFLLPLAEGALTSHFTYDILRFFISIKKVCKEKGLQWPLAKRVCTDWSFPLMNAVIIAFNDNMSNITQYLQSCFSFLKKPKNKTPNFVILQTCCSHFVKNAYRDINIITSKNEALNAIAKNFIWACINTDDVSQFYAMFEYMQTLLLEEKQTDKTEKAYNFFITKQFDTCEVNEDVNEVKKPIYASSPIYKKSPFYLKALKIVESIKNHLQDSDGSCNPFHSKELSELFLKKYAPYIPIWTNIMGGFVSSGSRVSNSVVEGYFSKVKNIILNKQRNVRPSEYVRKSYKNICATLTELDILYSNTIIQKKRKFDETDQPDMWKRVPKLVKKSVPWYSNKSFGDMTRQSPRIMDKQLPKSLSSTKFYYGLFESLQIDGQLICPDIDLTEINSLKGGRYLYSNVVEIFFQILAHKKYNVDALITSCTVGEILFFNKNPTATAVNWNFLIEKKYIAIPVCSSRHFTLGYINNENHTFTYIDPQGASATCVEKMFSKFLNILMTINSDLSKLYTIKTYKHDMQQDSFNCGVFVCQFFERLCQNKELTNLETQSNYRTNMKNIFDTHRENTSLCIHCLKSEENVICSKCQQQVCKNCLNLKYKTCTEYILNPNEFECFCCFFNYDP